MYCSCSSACSMLFCYSMTFLTAVSSVVFIQFLAISCTITKYILQCIFTLISMWFIQSVLTDSVSLVCISAVYSIRSLLDKHHKVNAFSVSFSFITSLILNRSFSVEMFLMFDPSLFVLMTISSALFSCFYHCNNACIVCLCHLHCDLCICLSWVKCVHLIFDDFVHLLLDNLKLTENVHILEYTCLHDEIFNAVYETLHDKHWDLALFTVSEKNKRWKRLFSHLSVL